MFNTLCKLHLSKEMACIYADSNDTSKFHFGTIIAVLENEVAIQMISPDGENDGIIVIGINNINRIETNSQYVEKMKKLYVSRSMPINELQIVDESIIKSVLLFAFKEKQVVSIELLDSGCYDVVGIIKTIDAVECSIKQFDEYGYVDGNACFRIRDITKMAVSTQDEKRIMRLTEINARKNTGKNTGDGSKNTGDGSMS